MRSFIVLCLVAVACADKLGYNYHTVGHSDSGLSFTPGGSSGHVSSGSSGHVSSGSSGHGSVGGNSGIASSNGGFGVGGLNVGFGSSNGGFSAGGSGSVGGSHGSASAPEVELEKEFYTFTANEDDFSEPAIQNQISSSNKKNLRVIFIKGPENHGVENAALTLAKHATEQKTAIYVLTKQADLSNLSNKFKVINNNVNNKPEVHFVKYRTPEDAANAQKAIQSHYDSLGGTSQKYNGGVAPVLNFASKTPVASHGSHGSLGSSDSLGSFESSGSLGSFGSTGSVGSSSSVGSSGSVGSVGSFGSSGLSAPSSSYLSSTASIDSSGLSTTYLPALVARRYKK